MILRPLRFTDIPKLEHLHRKRPEYPYLAREQVIGEVVADQDGEAIAYGALEIMAEPVLIMDDSKSAKLKAEAIKLLVEEMKDFAKKHKIYDLYAFTKDDKYASLLKKHFGFESCLRNSLVLNLR